MTTTQHEAGPDAQLMRLVYLSTASEPNGPDVIEQILQASIPRNREAGITGLLCGGYQHFLQVLEGPERALLALYMRVANDSRHGNPVLLSIELITQRLFPDWAMAYIAGSPATADLYQGLLTRCSASFRVRCSARCLFSTACHGLPRCGRSSPPRC